MSTNLNSSARLTGGGDNYVEFTSESNDLIININGKTYSFNELHRSTIVNGWNIYVNSVYFNAVPRLQLDIIDKTHARLLYDSFVDDENYLCEYPIQHTRNIAKVYCFEYITSFHYTKHPTRDIYNVNCLNLDLGDITSELYRPMEAINGKQLSFQNIFSFVAEQLTELDLSSWYTMNVVDMSDMFAMSSNLTSLNISTWKTSLVENLSNAFGYCGFSEIDISGWSVVNCTNLSYMFQHCPALKTFNAPNWQTQKVTTMAGLFDACETLASVNITGWKTNALTNTSSMFFRCTALTTIDLSGWEMSALTNCSSMFDSCYELDSLIIPNWTVPSATTDVSSMFKGCDKLTSIECTVAMQTWLKAQSDLGIDFQTWNGVWDIV